MIKCNSIHDESFLTPGLPAWVRIYHPGNHGLNFHSPGQSNNNSTPGVFVSGGPYSLLYGVTKKKRINRNDPFILAFGLRVRALRMRNQLTQEELSHRSGLWLSIVGRIERGEVDPTLSTISLLARGLGVHPKELFDSDDLMC